MVVQRMADTLASMINQQLFRKHSVMPTCDRTRRKAEEHMMKMGRKHITDENTSVTGVMGLDGYPASAAAMIVVESFQGWWIHTCSIQYVPSKSGR
jgi:hypothetical protein